jgi:hypothetical protein
MPLIEPDWRRRVEGAIEAIGDQDYDGAVRILRRALAWDEEQTQNAIRGSTQG